MSMIYLFATITNVACIDHGSDVYDRKVFKFFSIKDKIEKFEEWYKKENPSHSKGCDYVIEKFGIDQPYRKYIKKDELGFPKQEEG